jgi:hypothetical protein
MTRAERHLLVDRAAAEGWNPGVAARIFGVTSFELG